jgi:hypothetical protein
MQLQFIHSHTSWLCGQYGRQYKWKSGSVDYLDHILSKFDVGMAHENTLRHKAD